VDGEGQRIRRQESQAVNISLTKFGSIPESALNEISSLIDESYNILGQPMGSSVDLEIFDKAEGEQFFATHDALEGKPRIRVYLNKLLELPKLVGLAGIRRQVAHSILHGSLRFYLIKFPDVLKRAIHQYRLSYDFGNSLLYNIGMAAKEYEVTDLLCRRSFVDEQVAYARYILEPSSDEIFAWEIASTNRLQKILYLAALIRDISCAAPLVYNERFGVGDEIRQYIEKKLAHVSLVPRSRIQSIIYQKFGFLGADTFEKIDVIAKWVTEEILAHEL
jgi:hypothetical protein